MWIRRLPAAPHHDLLPGRARPLGSFRHFAREAYDATLPCLVYAVAAAPGSHPIGDVLCFCVTHFADPSPRSSTCPPGHEWCHRRLRLHHRRRGPRGVVYYRAVYSDGVDDVQNYVPPSVVCDPRPAGSPVLRGSPSWRPGRPLARERIALSSRRNGHRLYV